MIQGKNQEVPGGAGRTAGRLRGGVGSECRLWPNAVVVYRRGSGWAAAIVATTPQWWIVTRVHFRLPNHTPLVYISAFKQLSGDACGDVTRGAQTLGCPRAVRLRRDCRMRRREGHFRRDPWQVGLFLCVNLGNIALVRCQFFVLAVRRRPRFLVRLG